jgi:hypothetical protein
VTVAPQVQAATRLAVPAGFSSLDRANHESRDADPKETGGSMTIGETIEDLAATAARGDMPSRGLRRRSWGWNRARWTHVEYDAVVRVLTASGQRKRTEAEMDAHQGGGAS